MVPPMDIRLGKGMYTALGERRDVFREGPEERDQVSRPV